ncbi:MAG: hydroxyethylthiazole kinase [Clostridiales bacterium]|nr:hydroxyethylthiazole kinase [Clostridiales bacterium]
MPPSFGTMLARLREKRPLIHHITNDVVTHITANATLAAGASPIMAKALEEVEEVARQVDGLVLNIGTLTPAQVEAMKAAGKAAKERGIPIVLDPVGYGFTALRTQATHELLSEVKPTVIRGNQGEIGLLAGGKAAVKGVEGRGDDPQEMDRLTIELAKREQAVVAMTGPEDRISDGERLLVLKRGHPAMATITGSGCMATAVVASWVAAFPEDPLWATAGALAAFSLAGEKAAAHSRGLGSFTAELLDALAALTPEELDSLEAEIHERSL